MNSSHYVVGITGSSGLVGSGIVDALEKHGHRAIALPRPNHKIDESLLSQCDAVINLAGKPLFGRFTARHKEQVFHSRVDGTLALSQALARLAPDGPKVFVSASASGYYGHHRGDEVLYEDSFPGVDFLSEVCTRWEAACKPATAAGIRVVNVRTGIVQSAQGGQLKVQLPLFKLGLGGPLSLRGRQWMPWISHADIVRIYLFAVMNPSISGPINAVAPGIVRNRDYAHTLGEVVHRPALIPVPCFAPALLLGKTGAQEFACAGQRMSCTKLEELGFTFRHKNLYDCLDDELR